MSRPAAAPPAPPPAASPPGERPSQFRLVLIVGALSAFGPLSLDMYLPSLPSLQQDLGGAAAEAQLTLTACLLGLAGGQVLVGPLSDALGRRRPLLVGLFGYALASFLCATAPSLAVLIGLRLVQGLAGGAGNVIARAVVRDLHSGTAAARFFALAMAVNGIAPILAPLVGGQLLQFTTWRGVFVVLGVIGLGLIALGALGLPETLPPARRRPGGIGKTARVFRHLLADRVFAGYALASGLASGALFAYLAGSPFVLEDLYGASPQVFSLIFAGNSCGIILASQTSARLVTRIAPRRLLATGLSMSLIGGLLGLVAVLLGWGLLGLLPGLFLTVASIGLIAPNATALALADQTETVGSASALLGVLPYVIGGAVAPLGGLAGLRTALPMVTTIATLSLLGGLTFLRLTRPAVALRPAR